MKHAAEPEVYGSLSIFEKSCVYCGARFRVLASLSSDSTQSRTYPCPGCGKLYQMQAVGEPEVRLLHGRTDGKDDNYQDTMF